MNPRRRAELAAAHCRGATVQHGVLLTATIESLSPGPTQVTLGPYTIELYSVLHVPVRVAATINCPNTKVTVQPLIGSSVIIRTFNPMGLTVTGASDADAVALRLAGFKPEGEAWIWYE